MLLPQFQCGLEVNHSLFFTTLEKCKVYSDHWKRSHRHYKDWTSIEASLLLAVETGLLKFSWVIQEAVKQIRLLQSCWSDTGHFLEPQDLMADGLEIDKESEDGPERPTRQLQDLIYSHNQQSETSESTYSQGKPYKPESSMLSDVPFDPTFDDYASSSLDSQTSQDEQLGTYSLDINGAPLISYEWFRWRDRGL